MVFISSKKLDFIVKCKCMFFQLLPLQFTLFVNCVFSMYQHVYCSYMLILLVWNRFLITCLLQIVFNMYYMFISTILSANNLNSANVPLSNKKTNIGGHPAKYLPLTVVRASVWLVISWVAKSHVVGSQTSSFSSVSLLSFLDCL